MTKKHDRVPGVAGGGRGIQMDINFCSCQATGRVFCSFHSSGLPIDDGTSSREPNMHLPLSHSAPLLSSPLQLCRLIISTCLALSPRAGGDATRWGRVCCHLSELHPPKEWEERVVQGFGIGFVIGSFVAKNLEILLTYKYDMYVFVQLALSLATRE